MTVSGANRWTDHLSESLDLLQTNERTDGLTKKSLTNPATTSAYRTRTKANPDVSPIGPSDAAATRREGGSDA